MITKIFKFETDIMISDYPEDVRDNSRLDEFETYVYLSDSLEDDADFLISIAEHIINSKNETPIKLIFDLESVIDDLIDGYRLGGSKSNGKIILEKELEPKVNKLKLKLKNMINRLDEINYEGDQ